MGKGSDPSPRKRGKVEALLNLESYSLREIAGVVGTSVKVVRSIKARLNSGLSSSPKRLGHSGRKAKVTPRAKRALVLECKKNRRLTSKQLQGYLEQQDINVSTSCVRRHLIQSGLKACRPRKKPLLTEVQREKRLAWGIAHKDWTEADWCNVCFSDESTFEILDDKTQYVRRFPGEEYSPQCLVKTVKHPVSVMVWSMISSKGVGRLHIVEGRMNQQQYISVLKQKMLPEFRKIFAEGNGVFQQDSAPCHVAHSVIRFLRDNNVTVLPWPGSSPDMNPIENLWMIVKKRLAKKKPTTRVALIEGLIDIWHHDPEIKELCPQLIKSMGKRVADLVAAKGWSTKY